MVLLLTTASCAVLTGLIWTIQRVHYPLFELVPPSHFAAFHARHSRRIAQLVAPLMLAELLSASWLLLHPGELPRWFAVAQFLPVAGVWLLTGLVFVPLHGRLAQAPDPVLLERLVRHNWPRSLLWTARLLLLLWWQWRAAPSVP